MLVVAFDMTLAYPRLCHAAWLAAQGIPVRCDESRPRLPHRPGRGAGRLRLDLQMHRVRHRPGTGRRTGETRSGNAHGYRRTLRVATVRNRHGGDRIYTDVATARNAGSLGVLVLSGGDDTRNGPRLRSRTRPDRTHAQRVRGAARRGTAVPSVAIHCVFYDQRHGAPISGPKGCSKRYRSARIPQEVPVYNTNCDAGSFSANTTTQ